MQAIVYDEFGPAEVLHPQDLDRPIPKDQDVLVRVRATSVNYGDLLARDFRSVTAASFNMPGLFLLPARMHFGFAKPRVRVLGSEYAGIVEAVGPSVKKFEPGDDVFGYLGQDMGAYAEFIRVSEQSTIALKPALMTFEEAAVTPYGAIMAIALLDRVAPSPDSRLLIVGASGSIGSAAVQIAKARGIHVTGIAGARRADYVRSLGADVVLDYVRDDFTQLGESWDVIFDVLGKSSFTQCRPVLRPGGRYLRASFKMPQLLRMLWTSVVGDKRVICHLAPGGAKDLRRVRELADQEKVRAHIDRRFPLAQAAAAHRYVEEGRARGKVALTLQA
jgi:NADPH:quinone reductase-like Zn-dependent oxidoreductase